jgi:hypothetical protein
MWSYDHVIQILVPMVFAWMMVNPTPAYVILDMLGLTVT